MLFFLPPLVLSHSRGVCSFQFPSVFWVEFGIHVCLRMSVTNLSQTLWQCFCFFPCLSCDPVFSFPFFCSFPQGLAHLKLQSRGMGPVFLFSFVLFFSFLFFPISLLPKSPLHNPIIPTISYTIRCCSSAPCSPPVLRLLVLFLFGSLHSLLLVCTPMSASPLSCAMASTRIRSLDLCSLGRR